MFQVSASNAKGDFVLEVFESGEEADIRHNQLYHEIDEKGLYKWGTIRTTNMEYNRDDTVTGLFWDRTEEAA